MNAENRPLDRMTGRDWLWPVIFLLLGAGGVYAAYRYFFQAFPEASVDLRLTRGEIESRAADFAGGRGLRLEAYRRTTLFDFDNTQKTYLERELGLEQANRLMAAGADGQVHIWHWKTRFSKPPEKEQITVRLTPHGKLFGFEHVIEEAREGARLAKMEAQRVAEVFLRAERGLDLARFDLVSDTVDTRPNRLDYTFTWEEKDFKLKDATRRFSVTVLGDQVGGFREFLKIPEQWERDYATLRSKNDLYTMIATVLYVALLLWAAYEIFRAASAKNMRWKPALLIGAVAGTLMAVQQLNNLELTIEQLPAGLSSNAPYEALVAMVLLAAVVIFLLSGAYVAMLAASGEPLYRQFFPARVALGRLFTFPGMRTKEFFTSTLIGYGMAGMHIGLVVLFYMAARNFGAWAPMDVKYNNAISTPLPWIEALAISFFASTSEEFPFRLFAVPALMRLTRSKWIAVLVPAFLWGFLHSNYPQQPAWIRGVEVGLIGVVAGWVLLRFGILATLVWHYTVDAVLIGMFLLRSENLTYRIAGALVGDAVLLPLLISVVFYLESRGFLRDPALLNSAVEPVRQREEPATAEAAVARPAEFDFMSPAMMRLLALAGVVGLAVSSFVAVPSPTRDLKIAVSASQAEAAAVDFLRQKGVAVEKYRRVTRLQDGIGGSAYDYLREHGSREVVAATYRDRLPQVHWRTRFFQELQKEEYVVLVPAAGPARVERYNHILDEKTPGAQWDKAEAQQRAEAFLAQAGVQIQDFKLVEHDLQKREKRNDHRLTWEANAKIAAEATHRLTVQVQGDEITGPRHFVKVPEAWERLHTQTRLRTLAVPFMFIALGLGAVTLAILAARRVSVHWRAHAALGAACAAIRLVEAFNELPAAAVNYDTSQPWATAAFASVAGGVIGVVGIFVMVTGAASIAEVLVRDRFGDVSLWARGGTGRARQWLEGLFAGIFAALALQGVERLASFAASKIPSPYRGGGSGLPDFPVSFLPGLDLLASGLSGGVGFALLVIGTLAFGFRWLRHPLPLAAVALALAAVMAGGTAVNAAHFAKSWIVAAAPLLGLLALAGVLRFNAVSYVTAALVGGGVFRAAGWLRHDGLRPFAMHALAGFVVLALLALWLIRREAARGETSAY